MRAKLNVVLLPLLAVFLQAAPQSRDNTANEDTYENHNQVDYGPLKVSVIVGVAIDMAEGPVPHARVLVFTDRRHALIAHTKTDADGKFGLPQVGNGNYRLVVKSYGFCSANVPIIVQTDLKAKRLVIHMKMGEVDACSYGDFK